MAEKNQSSQSRQKYIKTPYKESDEFRLLTAESVVVQSKADEIGAVIQILFTNTYSTVTSDKVKVEQYGDFMRNVSVPEFETSLVRIAECCVNMRPDQALSLASAIMQQLSMLPEQLKLTYRIPDIASVVTTFEASLPPEGAK